MDNTNCPPPDLALCPRIAEVFGLIGKRWNGQIIALLLQREARFSELAHTIDGLSERMLSERLRELEDEGIVGRTVDPGPPVRVTYALTTSGRALEPAMTALRAWAEQQSHS
ncbi:MAG: helix-turn-helix domain-containing protein [Thermoleophilia bacterium]